MKLKIDLEILNKTEKNIEENIKVLGTVDIVKLKEVKAIQNAVKEHLLFIGLDRGNNIRNISVLGIGNSCNVIIDSKDIIRTALFSCSDKVILVHNHPSNSLKPSNADIHITNITNKILKAFNIELTDHIIVTENNYLSMEAMKQIDKNYYDEKLDNMDKGFILEENQMLRKQIEELEKQIQEKNMEDEIDDDFECITKSKIGQNEFEEGINPSFFVPKKQSLEEEER